MLRRLRFGEKLAAAGALALLGSLFVNWFNAPVGVTGWHALGWLALALCVLAILAGLALPLIFGFYESPVLPVLSAIVTTFVGLLAALAIVVQAFLQPGNNTTTIVLSGCWFGLLSALGVARGGFLSMRDEYLPAAPMPDVEVRPAPPAVPSA